MTTQRVNLVPLSDLDHPEGQSRKLNHAAATPTKRSAGRLCFP